MNDLRQIDAFCVLDFDARLEREAMEQIAGGIAALFDIETPRERIGLIVVSDNAGTATSVQFWSDAVATGVAVASPELFPWCLANAPCGALARRFHITGPNSTLLGESDALLAALDTAADQITQRQVDKAVIVVLSFANGHRGGKVLALRVCAHAGRHALDLGALSTLVTLTNTVPLRAAIDMLRGQLNGCSNRFV